MTKNKLKGLKNNGISDAQKKALIIIKDWVDSKNIPMPKQELFKRLVLANMSESTARKAMQMLVKKGYVRRAVAVSNQTFYVLLRWL